MEQRSAISERFKLFREASDHFNLFFIRQYPEQRRDSVTKALLRAVGDPAFIYDVTNELSAPLSLSANCG
jgi:hypothetical protein